MKRWQDITWINDGPTHWRIYMSSNLNEFVNSCHMMSNILVNVVLGKGSSSIGPSNYWIHAGFVLTHLSLDKMAAISQTIFSDAFLGIARRLENDNTPQPLDQWANSPLMGQQVGNCKSLTLIHYLADLIVMHRGPMIKPIVHPTSHPTHIPFIPSELNFPFLRYSNVNILPWKSKVKVIGEVKVQSCNMMTPTSYRYKSRPPPPPPPPPPPYDTDFTLKIQGQKGIAEGHKAGITPYRPISLSFDVDEPSHSYIQLYKKFTLKIQGQGHRLGERWKSQHGSNILSTHVPIVPCQSAVPFLRYDFFSKFDLENPRSRSWLRSKLKVTKWM